MDPQIFPGAFVIRNTKTWGVLTALWDPEVDDSPRILIGAQDEESNRSFQVWWIEEADFGELMPNQTRPGDDGEVYYTITHMDSGLRLHTGFEDRVKSTIGFDGCERVDPEMQVPSGILPVELRDQDTCGGGNGQFWKLSHAANPDLERDNDVDKISLTSSIKGLFNNTYTIKPAGFLPSYRLVHSAVPILVFKGFGLGSPQNPENHGQWDLVIPVLSVPAGWVQIRNCFSKNLLAHTSLCLPPIMVPQPGPENPSQSRDLDLTSGWATQWAIRRVIRALGTSFGMPVPKYYQLQNRLTGGIIEYGETDFISVPELRGRKELISAKGKSPEQEEEAEVKNREPTVGENSIKTGISSLWHLDKARNGKWVFINWQRQMLRETARAFREGNLLSVGDPGILEDEEEDELSRCWEFIDISKYAAMNEPILLGESTTTNPSYQG